MIRHGHIEHTSIQMGTMDWGSSPEAPCLLKVQDRGRHESSGDSHVAEAVPEWLRAWAGQEGGYSFFALNCLQLKLNS